jgi:hypothetical protein
MGRSSGLNTQNQCIVKNWTNVGSCDPYRGLQTQYKTDFIDNKSCVTSTQRIPCKVDCKVSGWKDGTCDYNGQMEQFKEIIYGPQNGGAECPELLTQSTGCKFDCQVSDWENMPDSECVNGKIDQFRTIIYDEKNGGVPCSSISLTQSTGCGNNFLLSDWKDVPDSCDLSTGIKNQYRTIMYDPKNGSKSPELTQSTGCKVDCVVSEWQDATGSTCDPNGNQPQFRTIIYDAKNGGAACPPLTQQRDCPFDCVMSEWQNDFSSGKACNPLTNTINQYRKVIYYPKNGGAECGGEKQATGCSVDDCQVGSWYDPWIPIPAPEGYVIQERMKVVPKRNNGKECPPLFRTIPYCEVGEWYDTYTYANVSSNWKDAGKTIQKRNVKQLNQDKTLMRCPNDTRLVKHCQMSEWETETTCDPITNTVMQGRRVIQNGEDGGNPCPSNLSRIMSGTDVVGLVEERNFPCPIDCQVSEWVNNGFDENGNIEQTRSITVERQGDGLDCPSLDRIVKDCKVSDWSSYSDCNSSGFMNRTRIITQNPTDGGMPCPVLTEDLECDKNCEVSEWYDVYDYIDGRTVQKRDIISLPKMNGLECPPYSELTRDVTHCKVSEWENVGECKNGSQTKSRRIIQDAADGGNPCPVLTEEGNCPIDCQVGPWITVGSCDENGIKQQIRSITVNPENNGLACPVLSQTLKVCETNCKNITTPTGHIPYIGN